MSKSKNNTFSRIITLKGNKKASLSKTLGWPLLIYPNRYVRLFLILTAAILIL